MKHLILILSSVVLLTGCLSFKDNSPPPTLFLINAPQDVADQQRAELSHAITVDKPKVVSGLNTDRIALVKEQGRVLDYFAEARWNGRLENIVQDFMIETLENRFRSVSISDNAVDQKADYRLLTHIRDFQAEYPGSNHNQKPVLKVSLAVSALRLEDNEIVFRSNVTEEMPSPSNTLTDITYGLETLMQKVFRRISDELMAAL